MLISSSLTNEVIQTIQLPQDFVTRCRFFQWFGPYEAPSNTFREQESGKLNLPAGRILLADNDAVRIYDVADSKWQAVIDKAAGSSGRIADVSFGHTEDEVLVFSDFGVKLTIWSLITRRAVEIRDPKYMVHCHGYRPWTGHLAILTRPAAQDILMLLNPKTYELVRSAELPTIDCQEISWSPDGNWIAIRDVASAGYKVLIYTADGHLYKFCYSKNILSDISLGVKEMQWSPSGGVLAIGDNNDHVELFSKDTVGFPIIITVSYC